jgi:hypothetical protein
MMFLSASELRALTGRTRQSAQMRWLRGHGWKFTVNALGQPIVAVAEANRHLVGGTARKETPNWGAINGTAA